MNLTVIENFRLRVKCADFFWIKNGGLNSSWADVCNEPPARNKAYFFQLPEGESTV